MGGHWLRHGPCAATLKEAADLILPPIGEGGLQALKEHIPDLGQVIRARLPTFVPMSK